MYVCIIVIIISVGKNRPKFELPFMFRKKFQILCFSFTSANNFHFRTRPKFSFKKFES